MPANEGEIVIRFGNEVYRGNYLEDLRINEATINDMLAAQPSLFVFWAKMCALQRAILEKKKMELDRYEAQLDSYIRAEKERRGEKVTEKIVENAIKRDSRRDDLANQLLAEKLKYDQLVAIKEAFSQRASMLMSIGANLREELSETQLSVREKEVINERLQYSAAHRNAVEEEFRKRRRRGKT